MQGLTTSLSTPKEHGKHCSFLNPRVNEIKREIEKKRQQEKMEEKNIKIKDVKSDYSMFSYNLRYSNSHPFDITLRDASITHISFSWNNCLPLDLHKNYWINPSFISTHLKEPNRSNKQLFLIEILELVWKPLTKLHKHSQRTEVRGNKILFTLF